MNQINKSIRDNYSMYMSLLRCDKTTEQEIVALSNGRGSHKRYRNARIGSDLKVDIQPKKQLVDE